VRGFLTGSARWVSALIVLATMAATVWRIEIRSSQIHLLYGVNRPPFN